VVGEMVGFIVRRLISAALVLILTSMIVFVLFFKGPDKPAEGICQQQGRCTPQREKLLEHTLGFDQSVVSQYGDWAKGVFAGRTIKFGNAKFKCKAPCLGVSYSTYQPVFQLLRSRFPATLSLALVGATLYLTLGVFLGVLAARYRGTWIDRSLVSVSLFVSAFPYPLLALLIYLYGVTIWGIFPQPGYYPITHDPWKWATGLILAWLAIGLSNSTSYARFSRGSMLEVLGEDYVRTATAKGLSSRRVILKHALRAAIVPVITIFGIDFATLLAGTIFTEQIFGIQGIGYQALHSIQSFDLPIISATVLFGAALIVLANIVVDILYSVLDPRVRVA
jgi:peptide/nickel transport system permease protein